MFDIYGEMETAAEINDVARSLKEEGEKENLDKLCAENGIDAELAQMFWDGEIDFVTDQLMAAVGKLDMEVRKEKGQNGYLESIANFLKVEAEKDQDLAIAIRKKYKEAEAQYKEALKINKLDPSIYVLIANVYYMNNEIERSIYSYRAAVNMRPENDEYKLVFIQVLDDFIEDYRKDDIVAEKNNTLLICRLSEEQRIKEFSAE